MDTLGPLLDRLDAPLEAEFFSIPLMEGWDFRDVPTSHTSFVPDFFSSVFIKWMILSNGGDIGEFKRPTSKEQITSDFFSTLFIK